MRRQVFVLLLAGLAAVAWLCVPAISSGGGSTPLATERVASGLTLPVFATHAPGDTTRLFILEKPGQIRILNLKTGVLAGTPFLDIDSLVGGGNFTNSEQGLLGLAFHPDYQSNGFFYVYYTDNNGDTAVVRYTRSTADVADAASATPVLQIDQPQGNHNAGWMGFGPNDGYLYIASGDGGGSCDDDSGHTVGIGNGQDITDNLLGKMLRIDVDGDDFPGDANANYAIPADNPFVGVTGDDEIWAYGLRNPWRCSFDRATGDLYIGDVGQSAYEEVDFQPASSPGGENYGWRCMEGSGCSTEADSFCVGTGCECGDDALTDPIHDYSHLNPPSPTSFVCSVTGGYAYRGCAVPDLAGHYFFADYCGDAVWSFVESGGAVTQFTDRTNEITPSLDAFTVNDIVSFGEDARGEMYVVDQGGGSDGQIFRLRAAAYSVPFTDIVCDLDVGIQDLLELLGAWGPCVGCAADVNGDDVVGIEDLLEVLGNWGPVVP